MEYTHEMPLNDGDLIEFEDGEVYIVGGIQKGAEDRFHVRLDQKFKPSKNLTIRKRH